MYVVSVLTLKMPRKNAVYDMDGSLRRTVSNSCCRTMRQSAFFFIYCETLSRDERLNIASDRRPSRADGREVPARIYCEIWLRAQTKYTSQQVWTSPNESSCLEMLSPAGRALHLSTC